MDWRFVFLTLLVSFLESGRCVSDFVGNETALRTLLFTTNSYSSSIRPDEKMSIAVKLHILTLNELNMKSQTLDATGWLTMTWTDSRLTWTPSSYGGIEYIWGKEAKFWTPLVFVDNSVGSVSMIADDHLLLKADYQGHVTWEPPAIYTTHCEIITSYYPFDVQTCFIEIVSWAYTINEINLTHALTEVNLEDYRANGEWTVIESSVDTNQLVDGHEVFSQLEFIVKFRRRPMFYVFNIILPIILLSFIAAFVFVLPIDSGEKLSFALTTLLAFAVLLTLIADNMPSTSHHYSVLSVYLALILVLGTMSVILSVLSLHLYHQPKEKPIPRGYQRVIVGFLMKFTGYDVQRERGEKNAKPQQKMSPVVTPREMMTSAAGKKTPITGAWSTEKTTDDNYSKYEWTDLAKILDIFFFRLYMVLVLAINIICLLALVIGGYSSSSH